ncbi:MAG: hypothetical protein MNSN_08090 [Minisyncoccus archaeiphilus]|uniref:O-antigen ligase family protein n=1 Tax=Minisyncoccus archaeiphilus TaxID=3238481 RepID=UPI002B125E8E|nr:MAG: hypothetical protein MNSN_08090 [Candidatus Parcubacteria bacterium]
MNFSDISKKLFYVFLFLFPFFFIPESIISPVMNQKAFLLIGLIVVSLTYLVSVFVEKKEIKGTMPFKLSLGFLVAILISFALSGHFLQGYWGYPLQSDSIFSFSLFFGLLFLASNIFDSGEERVRAYKVFSLGALGLAFLYLFQIGYGAEKGVKMILPGSEESAIIFSLGLTYMLYNIFQQFNFGKKEGGLVKICLMIVFSTVFIAMLYLMGIKLAWLLVTFGLFFVFWKFMQRKKFDVGAPETFISFILMVFFMINFLAPLDSIVKPLFKAEPVPTFSQSLNIVQKAISVDTTTTLFGTGPATFPFNFSKYKDSSFEDKDMVYTHPSDTVLLILNDFGVVGLLSFLSLVVYFLWFTIKIVLKQRKEERDCDEILLVSPLFILFYSLFFYRFSFLVVAMLFLFLGLWISSREYRKGDSLSPRFTQVFFSVILISLLANAYYFSLQYSAEMKYQEAAIASDKKQDLDVVIGKIEQADATFKNNDYLIALSHLYLAKGANKYQEYFEEFTEKVGDVTKKEEALGYISKARAYAEKATEIDVRDYRVWDNLAYVYKNIETVSGDKSGNLVDIYKKVEDLYPLNYRNYLYYAQKLEEDGDLLGAFRLYKKAYEINPEFEGLKNFIDEIEKELNTIKQ